MDNLTLITFGIISLLIEIGVAISIINHIKKEKQNGTRETEN